MNNEASDAKATAWGVIRPIVSGALTNWIVVFFAGMLATIGVLLSPLQKVIFNIIWKERPTVSLVVDRPTIVESGVDGVHVIVSAASAVGLSGGVLTLSIDDRNAGILLQGGGDAVEKVDEFSKLDGPKVFDEQLIASRVGEVTVRATVKANSGTTTEAVTKINVVSRPIGNCKYNARSERDSSFAGRWIFDFTDFGTFEVEVLEQESQKLTGKFSTSRQGPGTYQGYRDGSNYWGQITFDDLPLKQIDIRASYAVSPDGSFLISSGGKATLQIRSNKSAYNWSNVGNSSDFQGFCRLH